MRATLRGLDGVVSRPASVARRALAVAVGVLTLGVLALGVVRVLRPHAIFFYTEAPVFGSLSSFVRSGSLAALYPPGNWSTPPLVLTQYTPLYFLVDASLMRVTGSAGSLVVPRAVSLAALVGALLAVSALARSRRVGWSRIVLFTGGPLVFVPGIQGLAAAAQVDVSALFITMCGVLLAVNAYEGETRRTGELDSAIPWLGPASASGPLLAATGCFALAYFAKQSYVAAPAALLLTELRARRWRRTGLLAALYVAIIGGGTLVLTALSGGGYLLNTSTALVSSFGWTNLTAVLQGASVLQWVPLLVLVAASLCAFPRIDFVVLWMIGALAVHGAAMLKTGSSVNYFLEPVFAASVAALLSKRGERARPMPGSGFFTAVALCGLAVALVPATRGLAKNLRNSWENQGMDLKVSGLEGRTPLVGADAFPAVIAGGGLPYLNDPFAFATLAYAGVWDATILHRDLASGRIPFVVTEFDLTVGPSVRVSDPFAGAGFAYFWYMDSVWRPVLDHYSLRTGPGYYLWLPCSQAGSEGGKRAGCEAPAARRTGRVPPRPPPK